MKQKNIKRLVITLVVLIAMILSLGQNIIYAATGTLNTKLSYFRYIKNDAGEYETKGGYALNTGTNHPVFQIFSANGDKIEGTNYYCLNATKGSTWTSSSVGTEVVYNTNYDLVEDKTTISGLDETYSNIVNSQYYTQIMWILDNLYTGNDKEAEIREYLAKAGIVYGETGGTFNGEKVTNVYYYDESVNPNSVFSDTDSTLNNNMYGNIYGKGGYWYGDENDVIQNVVISKDIIEVVGQAAIWYFTNYLAENNTEYDCYTKATEVSARAWIQYTNDTSNTNSLTWNLLANDKIIVNQNGVEQTINVGAMKQEQAAVLYNYLVDGANKAAQDGYVSGSRGTINLAYVNQENTIVEDGENYKIGPMKITTTGTITGLGIEVTTGVNTDITTKATITNKNGTTLSEVPENTEFYVIVPKTDVDGSVKITATGKYSVISKKLWIDNTKTGDQVEQPIVEVAPETGDAEDTLTATPEAKKLFDLALRKRIIQRTSAPNTNGSSDIYQILNESGLDATRNITTNITTIPDTAEYYHRKDPVVVETGNYLTYEISIYNEGEIAGYASKVVDQLPTGLKSVLKTGDKVTSKKGNVYNVTYNEQTNQVVLELSTSSTDTITNLVAFNGATLDSDTIEVTCEVVQEAATDGTTKHYLTNIAYIAEAYDEKGNKVESDRDGTESSIAVYPENNANSLNSNIADSYKGNSSNPSIYNDTNNEIYYKGQEDDDDFETLVVLPKDFDLKLLKYISEENGVSTGKNISVDTSNLNEIVNGKKVETADYDVSKAPISVNTGDYLKYTFRVYNEGQIDGYAKEITEDIPEELEFVWDAGITINTDGTLNFDNVTKELSDKDKEAIEYNANQLWQIKSSDENNNVQTISTTYLSKNVSTDNLIKAFDEKNDNGKGSGLYYKEVSVMLKVTATDTTKIIRNEAAITDDEDKNGADVIDRDSKPEEWEKKDSEDYYQDDENYPKYEQDDEDYDNIKIARFDLASRKFISSVSSNGEFSNTDTTITYNRVPQVDSTNLKNGTAETAIYNHSKEPVSVSVGNYILYTIRVYNEGDVDGYASEIIDYLPEYLDFVTSTDEYISRINGVWTYDSTTRKVTTTSQALNATTLLKAFDRTTDDGKGSGLSYVDVQIICKINSSVPSNQKLTNIAEISKYKDQNGNNRTQDADSKPNDLVYPQDVPGYNDDKIANGDTYIPGQEDDDDFEKVIISREPEIHKGVKEVENQDSGYNADEPQTWVIKSDIPANIGTFKQYQIVDDIDYRLNFEGIENVSVKIGDTNLVENTDYQISYVENATGIETKTNSGTLTITFIDTANSILASETLKNNENGKITITFNTTFAKDENGNLLVAMGEEIENQAKLKYTNSTGESKETESEKPEVHTGGVTLFKYYNDGENKVALEGAEFAIYGSEEDANNGTNPIKTINADANGIVKSDANGIVSFVGLSYGGDANKSENNLTSNGTYEYDASTASTTYWVVETKAPNGYSYSKTPIEVVINKDSYKEDVSVIEYTIENKKEIFDLALRKFITDISGEEITTRVPQVGYENGKITYTHPKDVEKVVVGDVVTYTLRIYNEGEIAGFAQKVTDDIPKYLEYLPENETNQKYRWVMYDKDGNVTDKVEEATKVVTDYTSKEYGETLMQADTTLKTNPNLLNAFDSSKEISDTNPDYLDVKIAFKVKDPNSNKEVITNNAQISEDADENGNPVDDVDSTPDEWIDGEDDQDSENVSVEYFDLSLLKYVSQVMVTENGTTTTTETKNDGGDDDIIPKVEIYRKSVNSTKVKFGYTIKITNEGDIAGYAKEITDYVPEGLKFYAEDNNGWTDEGNNVISTKLLENTLLQPGESATVTVILRWVNGENNLGIKTNIAEISEDYNDKDVPDRDSTPDNKKDGEDDIDDAPVLLAISTGMLENVMMYVIGATIILVVLGIGVLAIKKFVL